MVLSADLPGSLVMRAMSSQTRDTNLRLSTGEICSFFSIACCTPGAREDQGILKFLAQCCWIEVVSWDPLPDAPPDALAGVLVGVKHRPGVVGVVGGLLSGVCADAEERHLILVISFLACIGLRIGTRSSSFISDMSSSPSTPKSRPF